jgi:hypothetical protein
MRGEVLAVRTVLGDYVIVVTVPTGQDRRGSRLLMPATSIRNEDTEL